MDKKEDSKRYSSDISRAYYKILGFSFLIESDSKYIINAFESSYGRFKAESTLDKKASFVFSIEESKQRPYALFNGEKHPLPPSDNIHIYAVSFVMRKVIESINKYFLIHGGAVEKDGVGIVLSGPPSHGKTSLVLKLTEKGFNLLSDEYAPLDRENGKIVSFPQAVGIEDEALELLWDGKYSDGDKQLRNDLKGKPKWIIDDYNLGGVKVNESYDLKYFFLLSAGEYKKESDIVEIAFLNNAETIKKKFCSINGVVDVSEGIMDGYRTVRVLVPKNKKTISAFDALYQKEKDAIIYIEKVSDEKPDFSQKPVITASSINSSCLKIIENIRNFTKGSALFNEFEGNYSRAIFEVTGLLKDVKCFYLKPGNLDETADCIIDIIS